MAYLEDQFIQSMVQFRVGLQIPSLLDQTQIFLPSLTLMVGPLLSLERISAKMRIKREFECIKPLQQNPLRPI